MYKLRLSILALLALLLLAVMPVAAARIEGGERVVIAAGEVRDDDVIAGAGTFILEGRIRDDLIAAGQSLETLPGSQVGGGLLFGGSQGLLAGSVSEGARLAAGGLDLRGRIGGDLHATVGESGPRLAFSPLAFFPDTPPVPYVPRGLTVRPGALVEGNLDYLAKQDGAISAEPFPV